MLNRLNQLASLVLKIIVIVVVVASVVWIGFSVFINVTDKKDQVQGVTPIPPFPAKSLASKAIIIKNTGETLLSNNITGNATVHILNGYYELGNSNRQWFYHRANLTIDEKYMPVSIVAR